MDSEILSHHSALVYLMVTMSAADSDMSDSELETMTQLVNHLPVFRDYDSSRVMQAGQVCADLLAEEEGIDTVLGLVAQALPPSLRETAYAIACQVAVSDGRLSQEELRLLEMIRHELGVERLAGAAIERGVAALYRASPED
ncbi:MAG: tellurite resistance TerB family protein [Alphaproteobacteria bacterium]